MLEKFRISWGITQESYRIIRADGVLLLFPVLSFIFSAFFLALLLIPFALGVAFDQALLQSLRGPAFYAGLFVLYFALAFISTFFGVCTVHSVKSTLEGRRATLGESLAYAQTKVPDIALWALMTATVSIVFRLIESLAERLGWAGRLLTGIMAGLFGLAWTIATLFVVQGMVYQDLAPLAAVRHSVQTLKKAWGEKLAGGIGIGAVFMVFAFAGLAVSVLLLILAAQAGLLAAIAVGVLCLAYFVGLLVLSATIKAVFNTVLYTYAQSGKVVEGFDQGILDQSFKAVV